MPILAESIKDELFYFQKRSVSKFDEFLIDFLWMRSHLNFSHSHCVFPNILSLFNVLFFVLLIEIVSENPFLENEFVSFKFA